MAKAGKRKSTQKKKKAVPAKVHLLTVCDSVSVDPVTGKVSLYGLFDLISSDKFPAVVKPFALFAQLSGNGEYPISLELRSPDGTSEQLAQLIIKCEPNRYANVEAMLGGLSFKKPGEYQLALTHGKRDLHEPKTVRVERLTKAKKK